MSDEAHPYPTLDGRERLAETVAALRRPGGAFGVSRVDTIETHMSWVFLTDEHAYKLKKPIRTSLIDHTTIPARRRACEIELRLNRRLARSVYLAVVAVVRNAGGLRITTSPSSEPIVDWLVKMRRLPADRMLDERIRRGALGEEEVERLAVILASFFAAAEPVELAPSSYRERIAADIAGKRASLAQPRYGLSPAQIDEVYAGAHEWLARHGALLEERAARVVDGHGDLRPEHVCLERPPVVIDCLEFSPQLRALDPVSELAFLALECRRLGAAWIGERLLASHARISGDDPPVELIPFYQSHHALIRAAIAVWHLDDAGREEISARYPGREEISRDQVELWRDRARGYLDTAAELLRKFSSPAR